jgi:putative nucleotidyltransferase-like protein
MHADMGPEDELCLLLVRERFPPEAEQRARQLLAGPLAWNRILERVRAHQILPLVAYRLQRLGFPGVPMPVHTELGNTYRDNAFRNALLAGELARVLALLAEARVPVMPLKGVPLAESLYDDPALRVCADIDILVPTKHLPECLRLLRASGYQASFTQPSLVKLLARYGKDCALMRQDRLCAYPLQLHCGLVWGGPVERSLLEAIWSEAAPITFHGIPAFGLSAEWEFLYLAVHAARHGLFPLKWLVDLDRLCARRTLDWKKMKDRGTRLGWEQAVQSSLSACATLLDTPVPGLFPDTRPGRGIPRPYNLDVSGPSALQILRETLFSLRLLTSCSQKFRFLATRLFVPTPADCQWLSLPSSLFFLYYFMRVWRLALAVAGWLAEAGANSVRRKLRPGK